MNFEQAQNDMNYAYFGGATGVLASGVVWTAAGITGVMSTAFSSMLVLFFGGMFIHPVAMLLAKLLKRSGQHSKNNPFAKLAIESTILLFVGLFLSFFVSNHQMNWFFPIMLMIIGARYLLFQSMYGNRVYWVLGALLILFGMFCIVAGLPFIWGAFIGGGLELLFSILLFFQCRGMALPEYDSIQS